MPLLIFVEKMPLFDDDVATLNEPLLNYVNKWSFFVAGKKDLHYRQYTTFDRTSVIAYCNGTYRGMAQFPPEADMVRALAWPRNLLLRNGTG